MNILNRSAVRWIRPTNTRFGAVAFMAQIAIGRIGDAMRGIRLAGFVDLVIGEVGPGRWQWMISIAGVAPVSGEETGEASAKTAAYDATETLVAQRAARRLESAQHPAIGPAVWP